MPASTPRVGIEAEVARGIKETTGGVCSVTYCTASEATGCLLSGDGDGSVLRALCLDGRCKGNAVYGALLRYAIEADAKPPGTAKLRALGRTEPDPCHSMPCREKPLEDGRRGESPAVELSSMQS